MEVALQNGSKVLVDREDWDSLGLGRFAWNAKAHDRGKVYAAANVWVPERKKQIVVKMHRLILNAPPGVEVDHIEPRLPLQRFVGEAVGADDLGHAAVSVEAVALPVPAASPSARKPATSRV